MSLKTKAIHKAKYDVVTPAMEIFHDKQMVNERPPGMDFEEYKILRRIQTKVLKRVIHRAGPKVNLKRFKYSRKQLKNAIEASSSEDIRREVSEHAQENNSPNNVQRKQGNVSRRGGRKKSG